MTDLMMQNSCTEVLVFESPVSDIKKSDDLIIFFADIIFS